MKPKNNTNAFLAFIVCSKTSGEHAEEYILTAGMASIMFAIELKLSIA